MRRISIAARVFALSAVLGIALTGSDFSDTVGAYLLVCLLAALAIGCESAAALRRYVPVVEGALCGLLLVFTSLINQPIGIYLIAPALIAAIGSGRRILGWTIVSEMVPLAILPFVWQRPTVEAPLVNALPWLVIAIGMGMLGTIQHRLMSSLGSDDRQQYLEAQRLLHELRDVSRRLPSGLDPVVLSNGLLHEAATTLADASGQVLVRTEGGVFESLAAMGADHRRVTGDDPAVLECWATGTPVCHTVEVDGGREPHQHVRCVLPLRVGQRLIGVLVLDTPHPVRRREIEHLQSVLDARMLPLDTALLFDEIRRMATTEERHRLAREIHDGVAQEVASLGYLVDDLAVVSDDERPARIDDLRRGLTRVVDDLRLSIFELRSQVSRSTGLGLVLSEYLREVGLRSTMAVSLSIDETADRLPPAAEEELLRIVQEGVTNARRHSGADNVWVTCRIDNPSAELFIDDDGHGFRGPRQGGYGLTIMRERAERIGATFSIANRPGGGTRIAVTLAGSDEPSTLTPFDASPTRFREQSEDSRIKETAHG